MTLVDEHHTLVDQRHGDRCVQPRTCPGGGYAACHTNPTRTPITPAETSPDPRPQDRGTDRAQTWAKRSAAVGYVTESTTSSVRTSSVRPGAEKVLWTCTIGINLSDSRTTGSTPRAAGATRDPRKTCVNRHGVLRSANLTNRTNPAYRCPILTTCSPGQTTQSALEFSASDQL